MKKITIIADNIITALGSSTHVVMNNLQKGISGIAPADVDWADVEPFMAAFIDNNNLKDFSGLSPLEALAVLSVETAAQECTIDLSSQTTLFIISSTKGNIKLLDSNCITQDKRVFLWHSAKVIANYFRNPNIPIVVSNACISGLSAQVVAMRYLKGGFFDNVVIVGMDELSKFIVSGFQSFKALSTEPCKPFDKNRTGLNLGEGVATLILSYKEAIDFTDKVTIEAASITNDANHISGPSRTGEGLLLALQQIATDNISDIGFINAHGTATPYNDEMEAVAFGRAGLSNIPVNSLKGYFGHTLGAAGVIETIVSARCLQQKIALASLGFQETGVSVPLNILTKTMAIEAKECIKTASGFGGCNAAIRLKYNG